MGKKGGAKTGGNCVVRLSYQVPGRSLRVARELGRGEDGGKSSLYIYIHKPLQHQIFTVIGLDAAR